MKEGRNQYGCYMLCYAIDVMRDDRRTPDLSDAPLYMKDDTASIEIYPQILDLDLDSDSPA